MNSRNSVKKRSKNTRNGFRIFRNIRLADFLPITPIFAFPVLLFNSIDLGLIFDIIRAN